jgi:hypothetical protein
VICSQEPAYIFAVPPVTALIWILIVPAFAPLDTMIEGEENAKESPLNVLNVVDAELNAVKMSVVDVDVLEVKRIARPKTLVGDAGPVIRYCIPLASFLLVFKWNAT